MRSLDGLKDSMDMSLSKLREMVMGRGDGQTDRDHPAPQMRKLSLCWGNWVGGQDSTVRLCTVAALELFISPPSVPLSAVSLYFPLFFPGPSRPRIQGTALVGSQRGAHAGSCHAW